VKLYQIKVNKMFL